MGDRNGAASGVAGCHRAVAYAYQSAICPVIGAPAPLHAGVDHAHAADNRSRVDLAEQPGMRSVSIDGQVGDGLAVAVEDGGVGADRGPIGVRAGVCAVHGAVAIGVEVQVVAQFVPAACRRAAHAGDRAGEGGGVDGGVGRGAVAVQVVADGVELGEASDVDEVVVVVVVVDQQAAVGEHRIAGTAAEVPCVVGSVHRAVAVGVVGVPSGVDAGVAGGRLQIGGVLADASRAGGLPARLLIPIARHGVHREAGRLEPDQAASLRGRASGGDGTTRIAVRHRGAGAGEPDQPPGSRVAGTRRACADGAAGIAGGDRRPGDPNQSADDRLQSRSAGDGGRRVAGLDEAALMFAHQPAGGSAADGEGEGNRPAGDPSGEDRGAAVRPDERADQAVGGAGDARADQAQPRDHGGASQPREEADLRAAAAHGEVGDRVQIAFEPTVVSVADGHPVGVRAGVAAVHGAVAVGVEVQVVAQFVAAARRRAAHARERAGEGGGVVGGGNGNSDARGDSRDAVAVQVVADGVELHEVP